MRPVERGIILKKYKEYGDARDDLIERLGDYCSYCETPLLVVAVEHIQPKSRVSALKNQWDNFLLSCTYCNSNKNNKPINANNMNDYFWADKDNTFLAFHYQKDRAPQIETSLNNNQKIIAQNTLKLTGLDRERGHPQFSRKDRRCEKRNEAWGKAERAKTNLINTPTDSMREQIIDTAISTGFFSVWMTVFKEDIDMRQRLINAFKGTSINCFDSNTQPISRGQL